jgi:hypothetical protein
VHCHIYYLFGISPDTRICSFGTTEDTMEIIKVTNKGPIIIQKHMEAEGKHKSAVTEWNWKKCKGTIYNQTHIL